jgi:hypothetical protein
MKLLVDRSEPDDIMAQLVIYWFKLLEISIFSILAPPLSILFLSLSPAPVAGGAP